MSRNSRSPAWPFLSILACLFVLSITAPRAWERIAHHSAARFGKRTAPAEQPQDTPAARSEQADASSVALEAPEAAPEQVASEPIAEQITRLPSPDDSLAGQSASPAPPAPVEPVPVPAAAPVAPAFGNQSPPEDPVLVAARPLPPRSGVDEALVPAPPLDQDPRVTAELLETGRWSLPTTLLEQLATLCQCEPCESWVDEVRHQLRVLGEAPADGRARAAALAELATLVSRGQNLASQLEDPAAQTHFLRTHYALERRLAVWQQIVQRGGSSLVGIAPADERIRAHVAELQTLLASSEAGAGWREYLLLDRLDEVALHDQDAKSRRRLAREVLERLERARHLRQQHSFASTGPVALLGADLQSWAAEPLSPAQVVSRIETYERTGLPGDAEELAVALRSLNWSDEADDRKLASTIDSYYRGANVRLAVTGPMLNRFLPQPPATYAPIADTLIGIPVRGHSTAWTQLSLRLVPDLKRVRLGLEATGVVASDTTSTSGPATFYNNGRSTFLIQKLYVLGPKGLRSWPAISGARTGSNNLVSLETDFDGIPLFGGLVRSIARSQFQESQPQAISEAEVKLANRVRTQFDSVTNARLQEAQANFDQRVWRPLEQLGINVTPVTFSTSEERVVARLRVANEEQLGAHTPRPRAPTGSLVSLQLHQSALNNMLERLELSGRRFTLPELFQWISKRTNRPQPQLPEDLPDDVFITFAPRDAVQVQLAGQHAELAIKVAELTQGRSHWRNFTVRASYRPEHQDLQAGFQRDSGIRLEGETIKGKPELLLRGIFSRALSANRLVPLVPASLTSDARVKDLTITQFVVDDGWLGLACAAKRTEFEVRRNCAKPR